MGGEGKKGEILSVGPANTVGVWCSGVLLLTLSPEQTQRAPRAPGAAPALGPGSGAGGGGKWHREGQEGCLEVGQGAWPEPALQDRPAKRPQCRSRAWPLLLSTNTAAHLKYLLKVGRIHTVTCLGEKKCHELEQRCLTGRALCLPVCSLSHHKALLGQPCAKALGACARSQLPAATATAQLRQHSPSGHWTGLSDLPFSILSVKLFGFVHKLPAKQTTPGKAPAAAFPREGP